MIRFLAGVKDALFPGASRLFAKYSLSGVKRPGLEADRPPLAGVEAKNEWRSTAAQYDVPSLLLLHFMATGYTMVDGNVQRHQSKGKEDWVGGGGSIQETKQILRDTETAHALRSHVLMEGYPGSLSWVIHVQPGTPAVPQVLYGRISSLFHIITILSSDA